jgi:hypothetical protein
MYPYEEYCFLCLRKKTTNQRLMKTNCCQSTIHNRCVEDLLYILAHLSYEFTLECGQIKHHGVIVSGSMYKKQ